MPCGRSQRTGPSSGTRACGTPDRYRETMLAAGLGRTQSTAARSPRDDGVGMRQPRRRPSSTPRRSWPRRPRRAACHGAGGPSDADLGHARSARGRQTARASSCGGPRPAGTDVDAPSARAASGRFLRRPRRARSSPRRRPIWLGRAVLADRAEPFRPAGLAGPPSRLRPRGAAWACRSSSACGPLPARTADVLGGAGESRRDGSRTSRDRRAGALASTLRPPTPTRPRPSGAMSGPERVTRIELA